MAAFTARALAASFGFVLSISTSLVWSQTRLAEMNKSFQALNSGLAAIEKSGRIDGKFDVDAAIDRYVTDAFAAFQEAQRAVEKDAEARKDTGGRKMLLAFEEQVKKQKARMEQNIEQINRINVSVREGRVRIDPALLKQASPDEIKEFSGWLTPLQRKQYNKIDPRISQIAPEVPHYAENMLQSSACVLLPTEKSWLRNLFEGGADLLVSPAHAALGASCYGICAASLGIGCIVCIAGSTLAAKEAYDSYARWRDSCGRCRWYKPWACACRAAAAAAFLAALA